MSVSQYAIVGDADVDVTVGSNTYRAYSFGVAGSGNQIEARAFEDDPDETAVVVANKGHDITLSFRHNPGLEVNDVVSISVTVDTTTTSYSATVTSTNFQVGVAGIGDWSATFRVNPAASS